jgi:hypothetical protein
MEFHATAKRATRRHSLPFLARWTMERAFRDLTAWARTLPNFVIVGAQRCGTTSLYNYLVEHPDVSPAFMKETHFFDLHFHKGLSWYRAHFPVVWNASRTAVRAPRSRRVAGEATPYYLFYPHTPHRVHATVPGAKLIMLLRNPVDRAYSHYHHEVATGVETASFEEALEREEAALPAETARILRDESYRSFAHFHYSYLSRGVYVDQLERWGQFFPREQTLILKSEEFYERPAAIMEQVMGFLDLPPRAAGRYRKFNEAQYAAMQPDTQGRLVDYFRPHNERLYAYLGTDLGW